MYIDFKNQFFSVLVILFTAYSLSADQVILNNGKQESLNISKISAAAITGSGKSVPLSKIKGINFSSSELPAKKTGIIFKDGSLLTGVIRKTNKKEIVFRSTAFGVITLPLSDIAAIFYQGTGLAIKSINKLRKFPVIIQLSGTELTGKRLWCDLKSAGILTKSGLKKILAENLALVCYAKSDDKSQVTLRNGNKLPKPQSQNGTSLKFRFGNMPIAAVKKYQINVTIKK